MLNYYFTQADIDKQADRRLAVVRAVPNSGAIVLVDRHIQNDGLNLELHPVVLLEIVLVYFLRPIPPQFLPSNI
jgi:hypothetical protein